MVEPIFENRSAGKLYRTERIHEAAVLITAGHRVHEYTQSAGARLVISFPQVDETGRSVHDTIRDYGNHDLLLDAKTLIDTWMHIRDLTRNKEFAVGTAQTIKKLDGNSAVVMVDYVEFGLGDIAPTADEKSHQKRHDERHKQQTNQTAPFLEEQAQVIICDHEYSLHRRLLDRLEAAIE